MVTRIKAIFAIIRGIVGGLVFSWEATDWFVVRNAPLVSGHVVSREPTTWLSIPRADFTIKIDGSDTIVHARTQRGMMPKVPDAVRFHYSGDPERNVILFEQEMNPVWLAVVFLGGAGLLILMMCSARARAKLGWNRSFPK